MSKKKLDDNELVRGNYHILNHQKKSIKKIAQSKKVSESEEVRVALDNHIKKN
jgi:hypothetical protein